MLENKKSRDNFLEDGKTKADQRFFLGLASEFKAGNIGKNYMLAFIYRSRF